MFEMIPSKNIRNYLESIGYQFNDFEKVTLIYNCNGVTRKEKIDALKELHNDTDNQLLRQQIEERLEYEERIYKEFIANQNDMFVYLVDDENVCVVYKDFYKLLNYLHKEINTENNICFIIEKYNTVTGKMISSMHFNENNEILSVKSFENNDNYIYDILDNTERFEYHYVYIPTCFQIGDLVRNVRTNEYSILDTCDQSIQALIQKARQRGWKLHYLEATLIGYTLKKNGIWNYEFLDLTELESVISISQEIKDKELRHALESMQDWVVNHYRSDLIPCVIESTKTYVLSHLFQENSDLQKIMNAKDIDDIVYDTI